MLSADTGPFDDINVYVILWRVVEEIETACRAAGLQIGPGVVVGTTPELGLDAKQVGVMTTAVSIISVSMAFPSFCNQISKGLALTLPWASKDGEEFGVVLESGKVSDVLRRTPKLVGLWARILAAYAITGWPPKIPELEVQRTEQLITRTMILRAVELFAVGHEYGHHMLKHGQAESEKGEPHAQEHEADFFARVVSMNIATRSEPPNIFASSGAGGVIMLTVLELVRVQRLFCLHAATNSLRARAIRRYPNA